jgi:hypothetical protein
VEVREGTEQAQVIELLEPALELWRQCPDTLPPFEHAISEQEKIERESHLERFLARVQDEAHHPPRTRADRQAAHSRITAAFAEFGRSAMGLEDRHLELLLGSGFSSIGTALVREARRLDAGISAMDMLQATRNAWAACGLQILFGKPMRLTPSIFAYSMLYPYSDNYLDDPAITDASKRGFSQRFGRRLRGERIEAANGHEELIWRLIGMIDGEYARDAYPDVFASLLMIHRAQENSIRLRGRGPQADGIDVPRLSFDKGGTSVLADGYLAAGTLLPEQAAFAFNWGVLLQLSDDLQDVREDRQKEELTLFSRAAGSEPLDRLTSRTLQLARRVMVAMSRLAGPDCDTLKELIARSGLAIIIRSAGEASEFYSTPYIDEIESYSPFRFASLKEKSRQLSSRGGIVLRLFEAFLAGDDDEPAFPWLPGYLMPRF